MTSEVAAIEAAAGSGLKGRLPLLVSLWRAERRAPRVPRDLSRSEIESVGSALLRLQRGLTGKRKLAGAPYMEDPDLLGAYLLYYWPVSYLQASLAMAELGLRPGRILDLGSGPGPAAAAALDAGAQSADLADSSSRALDLAMLVLSQSSDRVMASRIDLESPESLARAAGPYDLIIIGHCLNEIWRGREDRIERRISLLSSAARLLAPGGKLLAIEPALLETSRELLALRDALAANGHPVLGPCPRLEAGPYPCPALASGPDRSCHMEADWDPPEPIASLARRAGLDRKSVKFSWFAIGPADADACLPAALRSLQSDGAAIRGRVISDPMLNKAGRLRYVLCSGGSLITISAAKDSPEARSSGFLSLKRGDVLMLKDPERRAGGGLGLGPESVLEIIGAAPRIEP